MRLYQFCFPGGKAIRRFVAAACLLAVMVSLAACQKANVAERVQGTQDQAGEPPQRPAPAQLTKPAPPPPMQASSAPPEPLPLPGLPELTPSPSQVILRPPPGVHRTVPVGLLLPLTGAEAPLGHALLDAAQMALFDVGDEKYVLLPRDTGGTAEGARAAAISALEGGAKFLLGPVFATAVAKVAPLARAARVNMIAFSNNRTVAGNGTFLIGLLPHEQIIRVVAHARSKGIERFAALVPETPFGRRMAADLGDAVARTGGVLTQVESYRRDQGDINRAVRRLARYADRRRALDRQREKLIGARDEASRRALKRLKGLETLGKVGFDAVFMPESGAPLKAVAPLLPFYDIDPVKVRLLGLAGWNEAGLGREPALVGAWFAAPSPGARADVDRRYKKIYGRDPHALVPLAYDAAALAAVLVATSKDGKPSFDSATLAASNGYGGTAGVFRFLPSGLVQRGLAVLQVEPDGVRVVSPAPSSFEGLSN